MNNILIDRITRKQLKSDLRDFRVGDTVVMDVRIVEGEKSRIQKY
ncbi:MAG: 50S ribosomal protein L19, partial [Mycoplasmatales bacterium]